MARQEIGGLNNSTLFVSIIRKGQITRYGGSIRCHDHRCPEPELREGTPAVIRVRGSRTRHYYCLSCALAGNHITVRELKLVLPRILECRSVSCLDLFYTNVVAQCEQEYRLVVA